VRFVGLASATKNLLPEIEFHLLCSIKESKKIKCSIALKQIFISQQKTIKVFHFPPIPHLSLQLQNVKGKFSINFTRFCVSNGSNSRKMLMYNFLFDEGENL
jgi:hypothetical protein